MEIVDKLQIGDYKVDLRAKRDDYTLYGFNQFLPEYNYRIECDGQLYKTKLSADGAVETICITDEYDKAFSYASSISIKSLDS